MRHFDLTPLYRSSIGFDRLANVLNNLTSAEQPSYPPYNIELKSEDEYRITMAVAGFEQRELHIEAEQNRLTIKGEKPVKDDGKQYLHQGIAARNFERRFQLADHVRVEGARHENGLLHIDLVREVPERMKPRTIAINSDSAEARLRSAKSEAA